MHNYQRVIDIAINLISAVNARDSLQMQELMEELNRAYQEEHGDHIGGYEFWHAFVMMNLAGARYFAFNNMFGLVHARYKDVTDRMDGFRKSLDYSDEQKAEIEILYSELEGVHKATPERHQNLVIGRYDSRCCLCRVMPANKTGSHMVPNFLTHPTFSWDGKGKRFHEALNHDFLNDAERDCQFYGREVPGWRFAQGEGKEDITDEDIEKNINQLEYDNEFCSRCEDRFGVLESAYSQYYNGQQKKIDARVAYLFWLSVLWRMSMGSMGIFMDMEDELSLRRLLDENMLDSAQEIADSNSDLGEWKYAIFRAEGLREGDKGIFGHRKESSPYVVMYNDLVMVFYHSNPSDEEFAIGPITIERTNLNDWHSAERSVTVDRRWFMNVRDWIVESSYDFYDPVREKVLRTIREQERSDDKIIDAKVKTEAIKVARLSDGPQGQPMRLHKMQWIYTAWMRKQEKSEKGESYNALKDEELFLLQKDFDLYYQDLAEISRTEDFHDKVSSFPFYEEARKAIPDERKWEVNNKSEIYDTEYDKTMKEVIRTLSPKELDHLVNGVKEPYVNQYKGIGRNDPCPCGSGKKFKKCCGRYL